MGNGNPVSDAAKAGSAASGIWGIILIIIGLICIAVPHFAGTATSMLIAISIIAAGIVTTVGAFQSDSWGMGILAIIWGIVMTLAGVYLLARPVLGMLSIALVLAIWFLIDGITEIIAAFQVSEGRGWLLFGGIVSLLLAYIIYSDWPLSGFWVVGTLVGIRFLFSGLTMMMLAGAQSAVAGAIDDA